MRSRYFGWLTIFTVAIMSTAASAQDLTLRCGSKLVKVGMTEAEVTNYCGQPASKEIEDQDVRAGNRVVGTTQVQRWTYKHYGATRVLVFDQDKLISIQ
jgi:hypothetical protein